MSGPPSRRISSFLSDLITRNARKAIDAHAKREAEKGKRFDRAALVRTVAERLHRPEGKSEAGHRAMVRVGLAEMCPEAPGKLPTRLWRADFLEAFAAAVEVPVHRLVHLDYEGEGKVSEASYAGEIARSLSQQLTPELQRRSLEHFRRLAGWEEMSQLSADVVTALLEAEGPTEAIASINVIIAKSKAWEKPRPTRKKSSPRR